MKKGWLFMLAPLLLGCAARPAWETVEDAMDAPVFAPEPKKVCIEGDVPVLEQAEDYLCLSDGLEIRVETKPSGDLQGTLHSLTGTENLDPIATRQGELTRYDCAWACAGEDGEQLGRTAILDDGAYHYCISVLWDEDQTKAVQSSVDQVFSALSLE